MKILSLLHRGAIDFSLSEDNLRYGTQLAASTVIAYLIPMALSLPEGFWAVMSALIVMRSRTGSTVGEGWGRIKGTIAGTLFGLLGVWLHSIGVVSVVTTLGVIAVLAFIAGLAPVLRSAPITALIILSSGGIAGHSAWQVAGLRIVEIAIGVTVGTAVSLLTPSSRSVAHCEQSVKALLEHIAGQVQCSMAAGGRTASEKEAAGRQLKIRLGRLALLAASADTERLFSFVKSAGSTSAKARQQYSRSAKLMTRIAQDAALFGRIFDASPELQNELGWQRISDAVVALIQSAARENIAEALTASESLADCVKTDSGASASEESLNRLLCGPVTLLSADIKSLLRLRQV